MHHSGRIVIVVLALLALAAAAVAAYTWSGVQDVSADGDHGPITGWWLETVRRQSVARAARDVDVRLPEPLTGDTLLEAVVGYEDMCAVCHAPPGREPSALARGLSPAPPDLAEVAAVQTSEALFWVTRHGIRMTGMPAWGVTHADDELWPIVALIQRFPQMSGDDYTALLATAREAGIEHHHDHDHDHEHGDHSVHDHDHSHEHEHEHEHEPDQDHSHDDHDHDHSHDGHSH
jgi:hypothetical protein